MVWCFGDNFDDDTVSTTIRGRMVVAKPLFAAGYKGMIQRMEVSCITEMIYGIGRKRYIVRHKIIITTMNQHTFSLAGFPVIFPICRPVAWLVCCDTPFFHVVHQFGGARVHNHTFMDD